MAVALEELVPAVNLSLLQKPVDFNNLSPNDFQKIKKLNDGSQGTVYLVQLRGTNKVFAMKVVKKADAIARNKIQRVFTEKEILSVANHPNLVSLYWSFQDANNLYFVMEYCAGGEFYQTLSRQATRILPETWAKFYSSEVLLALEYLHSEKFIYRDLKPENILVHHSGHLRLADFDLSTKVQMTRKKSWFGLTSANLPLAQPQMVGTEEYVAPEVVANQEQTFAIDWWSFGILLYEMLYGTTPFCADTTQETFALIGRGKVKFSEKQAVSKTCKDLIKKLLHTDPKKRLGANGADEVKAHPFFSGVSWTNINKQTPPIKVYIKDMFDTSYFWSVEDRNETESDEPVEPFVIGEDNCFKGFCYSSPRSLEYSNLVK